MTTRPTTRSSIDDMLDRARSTYRRTDVSELADAVARGAVLVDIRPQAQRVLEGTMPGALAIERNVLEWRCDPTSSARLAIAVDHDVEWIVLCSEGYTSSLAAAALQELGLTRASDVIGGYRAIVDAGLTGVVGSARHCLREGRTLVAH
ncbi:sulfurtransferase [Rhodococcus sp. BP-349]|uniref:rhodanese-like domain-containing protein n=1 Tax=unclassified Rhodococcus (in: high G+C Gram-positive bacteria) TaxID=192944 RepID=UPI001C9B51A2|nr:MULTISPECIES: rhodanese-like domain-containing protein [unclassified Rhodococcus (in: high G+C Gram-positive bacteria)]MBY6537368.1 sulfurtransferase [Rhodococcus sp. BP-363]MBY6541705.1 sulfurtransferase [Rhodococcus sp. BP-369]MBY6560935.1 sulfurtransferase [Rhodococcus sp. BP-370]MBY6575227.1 sulfurtransferase [Rhodococcus sp. BP-364]MBY6584528.1 sulfurtransferase [Rhodococcus sp. BP-358]